MSELTELHFARVGISLPCPVPVLPGTPDTMRADGEPIPIEQRTERCGVDGWWFIGGQPLCDIHLRQVCEQMEIDFESIVEEGTGGRGLNDTERKPWGERHRYPQAEIVPPERVA